MSKTLLIIAFLAGLSIAALPDRRILQLPTGFYNGQTRVAGIDQTGAATVTGVANSGADTAASYTAGGLAYADGGFLAGAGGYKQGTHYAAIVASATTQQYTEFGTVTLSTGAGTATFAPAYSSTPNCVCSDATAAAAVKCSQTATTITVAGTGSDNVSWLCVGPQ